MLDRQSSRIWYTALLLPRRSLRSMSDLLDSNVDELPTEINPVWIMSLNDRHCS